jgi:putative transposase
MIDRAHQLPLTRQADCLNISRGSIYYVAAPVSAEDLAIMRQIDVLHTACPFAGSRMLRDLLAADGCPLGRRRVTSMMQQMAIKAAYPKPNTSKPEPGHRIYPYLLRKLVIDRPNQVWATDITYIPMARGFVYLCAVMDWFARRVLAWRLSNTMEAAFCVETLEDALAKHPKPGIFNSDQGSQFTGTAFTGVLIADRQGDQDQHGRSRRVARQRVRRASLAHGEIRGGVPARLRRCARSPRFARPLHRLLQRPTPTLIA